MSETIDRIVYTSVATGPFSDADLTALLALSRTNNAVRDLTGLLLYTDGRFLQVLEGPTAEVRRVLARIAGDPRHSGVWTALEEHDVERRFGDWAMGFATVDADDLAALPGYNSAVMDPDQRNLQWLDESQVEQLIDRFRDARIAGAGVTGSAGRSSVSGSR